MNESQIEYRLFDGEIEINEGDIIFSGTLNLHYHFVKVSNPGNKILVVPYGTSTDNATTYYITCFPDYEVRRNISLEC